MMYFGLNWENPGSQNVGACWPLLVFVTQEKANWRQEQKIPFLAMKSGHSIYTIGDVVGGC